MVAIFLHVRWCRYRRATAGAVSGVGFATISGGNIGKAAWTGALSGLTGGAIGAYIGGAAGAFAGGASGSATGAALNGEDLKNIGISALAGGGIALGAYQLQSAINYRKYSASGGTMSRKQFEAVSVAAQRSFTRGREYGGWLLDDGSVECSQLEAKIKSFHRQNQTTQPDPSILIQIWEKDGLKFIATRIFTSIIMYRGFPRWS